MGEHTPGPWHFSWSAASCWLLYCSNALPSGLKRTTPLPSRPNVFVPSAEVTFPTL